MTRIGRRLIEDFLLPALNDEKYGDLLKWIDRDKRYFSIRWSHKNAAKWTLADTAVFQDWDRLKGHYHPEVKGYYMQAKQRFRAALYKLNTVRKLPCEDKHVKKYQLVLNPDKRHHEIMPRKVHQRFIKEEKNQKSIPTSVICLNTAFIAKREPIYTEESCSSPSSPPSPVSSIKSEASDKMEELECLEEYQLAQKQQLTHSYKYPMLGSQGDSNDSLPSVLRESPQMNMVRRTPHVPIQPVPVYNSKCHFRQAIENSQKRFESPHVLLVRTYNDTDMDDDTSEIKKEVYNGSTENLHNPDVALNLSIKCEDNETLSR